MTGMCLPSGNLRDALRGWQVQDPQAPALSGDGVSWLSRDALGQRLAAGAHQLRQAGLAAEDRVAVLLPPGLDGALVALQVAAASCLVPLRPGMPTERWRSILATLNPAVVLMGGDDTALVAAAEALAIPLLPVQALLQAPYPDLGCSPGYSVDPESRAAESPGGQGIVIATSGTTGMPKWVWHHQVTLLRGVQATGQALALTQADRGLLTLPLHHVHGLVSGLLMPLCSGGSVMVAERFDAAEVLTGIAERGISWITLPPAMHRALLDQHQRTPLAAGHRLRFLRSGAISLPRQLIDDLQHAFGVPVIEAYGMSECPHISCNLITAPRPGSVGKPVVERLAIVDGAGRALPAGCWGQVVVQGAPMMQGYLGEKNESSTVFAEGWLQTGDQGRLDADGYLQLRGRLSERINRGGLEVMPALVDAALLSHPAVREATAFPVPHPNLGDDLAAAVVVHPGAAVDEGTLRHHVLACLEAHEVPSRILVVEALPLGRTGKVERRSLAAVFAAGLFPEREELCGELEELVAQTFATVLQQPPPGRNANFFQLGGDSLSGQRVISALEQQLALELSPTLLFAYPTVRSLAEQLDQLLDQALAQAEEVMS